MSPPRLLPRPLRVAAVLLVAAGPGGCGSEPPIPTTDLRIAVTAPAEEVAPGRAFPLTVVRTWRKDLRPTAFDDRALAPLVVRLEEESLREDDERFEETRRYRAYAMSRADVTVRPLRIQARPADGSAARVAAGDGLVIRVKPQVDAEDPGAPELPRLPQPSPPVRGSWLAAAALAAGLLAFALARARRRPAPAPEAPPEGPPPPSAQETALRALAGIRGATPDPAADVVAAAEVVRTWLETRHAVPALERTTREVLASPALARRVPQDARAHLADLLAGADRVKFAAHEPDLRERTLRLEDAEAVLRGGSVAP